MQADPAFIKLYETDFTIVFRAAFMLSGDRSLAEDAAQEAFAKALERWHRIGDQPWAGGWVMTTALNVARKARRVHLLVKPRDNGQATERDLEASLDLRRAIAALPPRQQEAVILHYLADLPLDQVATVMGCGNGTVKSHLWRARQQLARYMADENA